MNRRIGMISSCITLISVILFAIFMLLNMSSAVQSDLTEQAIQIIDYQKFGLFFNYDLFGYCMLSISTFFIGITISPENKEDKILKTLLLIHGIFSIVCFIPMMGIFNDDMVGADFVGVFYFCKIN